MVPGSGGFMYNDSIFGENDLTYGDFCLNRRSAAHRPFSVYAAAARAGTGSAAIRSTTVFIRALGVR